MGQARNFGGAGSADDGDPDRGAAAGGATADLGGSAGSFWWSTSGLEGLVSSGRFLTLARRLASVPAGTPGVVVLESIAARQALIAHLEGAQLAAMHHLAATYSGEKKYLPEELALTLGMGAITAAQRLQVADMLINLLPATHRALLAGGITLAKARTIVDGVKDADPTIYPAVEKAVLPGAGAGTIPGLREKVQHTVIALDPDGAADRHQEAKKRRDLTATSWPDGMATLTVFAPAQDTETIFQTCQALAAAKVPGDERSIGNRRVDALTEICTQILATGHYHHNPAGNAGNAGNARSQNASGPGSQDGSSEPGPVAETDTDAVNNAGTGPHSGTVNHAGTVNGAAALAESDAGTVPDSDVGPSPVVDPNPHPSTSGDPTPGAAACCCGTGTRLPTQQGQRPRINITMADTTLLCLDDRPAMLTGHGPITAVQARAIAIGADLYRMITDPTTGTLLDLGRTRYRPNQALIDHIIARDKTCRWPGCRQPATRAELDHEQTFRPGSAVGGHTSAANQRALCTRHHHVRHTPGWTITTQPNNTQKVTTPLGNQHTHPLTTALPDEPYPLRPLTTPPVGPTTITRQPLPTHTRVHVEVEPDDDEPPPY